MEAMVFLVFPSSWSTSFWVFPTSWSTLDPKEAIAFRVFLSSLTTLLMDWAYIEYLSVICLSFLFLSLHVFLCFRFCLFSCSCLEGGERSDILGILFNTFKTKVVFDAFKNSVWEFLQMICLAEKMTVVSIWLSGMAVPMGRDEGRAVGNRLDVSLWTTTNSSHRIFGGNRVLEIRRDTTVELLTDQGSAESLLAVPMELIGLPLMLMECLESLASMLNNSGQWIQSSWVAIIYLPFDTFPFISVSKRDCMSFEFITQQKWMEMYQKALSSKSRHLCISNTNTTGHVGQNITWA